MSESKFQKRPPRPAVEGADLIRWLEQQLADYQAAASEEAAMRRAALADNAKLRALLERAEWGSDDTGNRCPFCGARNRRAALGDSSEPLHKDDCELAGALGRATEPGTDRAEGAESKQPPR